MTLLLPYQRQLMTILDQHQVVVCEKSRRIGMTWTAAAYAVLLAARQRTAGGMDVLYIGYNFDMTREFMATIRQWVRAFAAGGLPVKLSGQESVKQMAFVSGFAIKALSAHPRSLRGRQGLVILDEAAYHDDLNGLMKAAMAMQIWGGKVLVISTHHGQDSDFYRLVNAVVAGKLRYGHLRVTFDQALRQGLYHRVHGLPLPEQKSTVVEEMHAADPKWKKVRTWAESIRQDYGTAAAEELDCHPAQAQSRYFDTALLWRCCRTQASVLRWDEQEQSPDQRAVWQTKTLQATLAVLQQQYSRDPHIVGVDFGRHHDLSVFFVLVLDQQMLRHSRLVIELAHTPFTAQWAILQQLLSALPNMHSVVMDKGGNGSFLHEQAEQKFGKSRVLGVQLSREWYAHWMPALRAAIEAGQVTLPHDRDIVHDLGQIALINGVPKPLPRRSGRHADAAIALALAFQGAQLPPPLIEANVGTRRVFADASATFM